MCVTAQTLVFGGGEVGGGKRKTTPTENKHARLILGVMVAAAVREIPTTTENESERSFSGVVGLLLVVARGTHNRQKRACALDFGGYGTSWWRRWPEKAHNP